MNRFSFRFKQMVIKYIAATAIFFMTIIFSTSFRFISFPLVLVASFIMITLDYMISTITNIHDSPIGRGIVGFISAVLVIYAAQFFLPGYYISVMSSIIAGAIYSVIQAFLPNYSEKTTEVAQCNMYSQNL